MRARGLVHAHSCYSFDCEVPLADVAALARRRRLAFLVQTEHSNELTRERHAAYRREAAGLSGGDLLVAAGVEYASADNRVHVLAIGLAEFHEDLRLFPPERGPELLERIRAGGGFSILAHPERADAMKALRPEFLQRLDGVEVWNGKTDILGPSPAALRFLDARRRQGPPLLATVGLDLHHLGDYRPVGLQLPEPPADEAHLVALLRAGTGVRACWGPLSWDPLRAGRGAALLASGSKRALDAARRARRAWRAARG
jgi:predicted metal-dependent phosphoesterase TrpH